jgi:tRNA A-37 threonylcarbamoyl transferase component Bud32
MPERVEEIAHCDGCGNAMNIAHVGPFANVACPVCGKHTRVKREFGPYTLLRRHAIGGMSVVFVAQDNALGREVAVKILNENYSADARRIQAFEEEARVTASFSHPHVVRVFTTGRAFDRYYIAMELVVGGHFEAKIEERGTIPEREMLPLAIQVAEGLKAAHAAGLIHRDIKPGNILLDGEGNAKIVDFGLALLLDKGGTAQAKEIWATPYYVPPETIEGHPEDFRSDMYAFGATLYHALAGKPPCNEESMATNLLRQAKRKVVPLRTAAAWITPRTCAVVDRAMAYDPKERFRSYDELISYLNDARKHLRNGTPTPRPEAVLSKRRLQAKRRTERLLIGAGVAAVVAAVAGSAWWLKDGSAPPPAPPGSQPVAGIPAGPNPGNLGDPAAATRIGNLYREARAAVEAGEYESARARFTALREDSAVQEPTRSWAAVEAVLMPLLDGRPAAAREEAKRAAAHLAAAPLEEPVMKNLLLTRLNELGQLSAIPATAEQLRGNSAVRIITWMLAGLKNWEQGLLPVAVEFFQAVAAATPGQQDAWVAGYQKLAGDYLSDFKALTSPVFAVVPKDQAACDQALRDLDAILPALRTRGRAFFNVQAWKFDLERLSRRVAAAATPVTQPPPNLATVLGELARHGGQCDFSAAAAYLRSLPADPPGATRKSLLALTDSAAIFMSDLGMDLKRGEVAVAGRLRSGKAFTKVAATDLAGHLLVTFNGPSRECAWAEIAPDSVIEIYRVVIRNEQDETKKLRRHETAIAFEWLAGDRAAAVAKAAQLAKNNPAFKNRWDTIAEGLPK